MSAEKTRTTNPHGLRYLESGRFSLVCGVLAPKAPCGAWANSHESGRRRAGDSQCSKRSRACRCAWVTVFLAFLAACSSTIVQGGADGGADVAVGDAEFDGVTHLDGALPDVAPEDSLQSDGTGDTGALPDGGTAEPLTRSGRWLYRGGSPVWLIGYDLQQLFTDASHTESEVEGLIDLLADYGTTCFRIWINTWFLPAGNYFPFAKVGDKYDLDSFSDEYWSRVKRLTAYAGTKGIVVEVVVFSEYPYVSSSHDYWTLPEVYWRAAKNVNGVFADVGGDLYPEFFTVGYSQNGKNLTDYQRALANKAIDELGPLGNVFFQVHNEFPARFGGTGQYVAEVHGWQAFMADHFHNTKGAITSVHAHEGSGMQLYGLDYWKSRPSVDILNFHPYSGSGNDNIDAIGTLFGPLAAYGKVLMFDESHAFEDPTKTDIVTREMWAAFTNGIYYLAYTDDPFIIGSSGWRERAGRILTLSNVAKLGPWWNATRNPGLVTSGPGDFWQGLASDGEFYVYYFTGDRTTTAAKLTLPAGTYRYCWFDTRAWNPDGVARGQVSGGGTVSLPAPSPDDWTSSTGLVLVVTRAP